MVYRMNVVNAGAMYQVYGEEVQTYKTLPVQTYTVGFHPQRGCWLNKHIDLDTKEDTVYGRHLHRAEKIFKSFTATNRNFGVILSGKKGIGKSLMARMIAEKGIENDLPVIIVDAPYPGIADFLSSIEQEVVIIFDEFEKTFAKNDDRNPQVDLLSLFDGIDGGKKLFVITCNNPRDLNEYLINRPGRFHYHFEIACPTSDEVRAYMRDKIGDGFEEEIEKVVKLGQMADITYDSLRAIAFDLKQGYPLEETLEDLNINYERDVEFDVTVRLSNGWILTGFSKRINLYDKDPVHITLLHDKTRLYVNFKPSDAELIDGVLALKGDKARITCDWSSFEDEMSDEDAEKARQKFNSETKVEVVTLNKVVSTYIPKYAV